MPLLWKEIVMNRHHPTRPRARFVPRLEALEGRTVPTVAAVLVGQELVVMALTKQTHTVQIMDDPLNNKVTVTSPELPGVTRTFQNANIKAVTYWGSAGPNFTADRGPNMVTYVLQNNPAYLGTAPHTVTLNGGPKNDVFIGQVATPLLGLGLFNRPNVTITANGYGGNDTLALFRMGLQSSPGTQVSLIAVGGTGKNTEIISAAGDLYGGTTFNAVINGMQGAGDTQSVTSQGLVQSGAALNVFLLGGPGKDTMSANVRLSHLFFPPFAVAPSNGNVTVHELGFAGNDDMKLDVRKDNPADKPTVLAFMDGGPGNNTARSNLLPPFAPPGYVFTDVNFQKEIFDF
jgi:hypothetical protein